jgi:hypothetical protein
MSLYTDITIRGIEDSLYRQISSIAAREKKTIGTIINEALTSYLHNVSFFAIEKEYFRILDKIAELDMLAISGGPGANMLIEEYKDHVRKLKNKMQRLESLEEDTPKISMINKVMLGKSDLQQLDKIIIENCEKVILGKDVDQETFKNTVIRIAHVQTLEIPKILYPLILVKTKDCGSIIPY